MRVVIDPNVLISAAISPSGAPRELLTAWEAGRYELVVSPNLLDELDDVLRRPKLARWITSDQTEAFLDGLADDATLVADLLDPPSITADLDDDYLVSLARSSDADYLISGDSHLLELADPHPPVLTPRQFLDLLMKC